MKRYLLRYAILLALLASGCSGLKSLPYRPDIPPPAREALEDALRSLYDENREEVASRLEELVGKYPTYVEAHRQLQNLYMAENRYGYLACRYREFMESRPENPAFAYLYGRVLSDPENRMEWFSRSVDLDQAFFWGFNGLGYAHMSSWDFSASEAAFENAIHSAPDMVEPYLGLATLYLMFRKYDRAGEILSKASRRFPMNLPLLLLQYRYIEEKEGPLAALRAQVDIPQGVELDSEYFTTLLKTLDQASTEDLLRRILYRFGPLAEEPAAYQGMLDTLLGVCCRKLGNLSGALRYFSRIHAASGMEIRIRRELRYLYTVSGRLKEAYIMQTGDCPAHWMEGSRYQERKEDFFSLADRIQGKPERPTVEREVCDLSAILMEWGWLDEAVHYLSIIADRPTESGRRAAGMLEEIYRHGNFEIALRDFFLKEYKKYSANGARLSMEKALEELGAISRKILGKDIFENTVFLDFSPVGVLLDPRPSAQCSASGYFRRYNRFFLIGQKMGGPVEAYLLDLFDYRPDRVETVSGVRLEFDLARCEHLRIPSLVEFQGGNIAGAGLHSIVFINLDAVRQEVQGAHAIYRQFREREDLLLEDPPPAADGVHAVRNVTEPLGLATRLNYLSFKETGAEQGIAAYMDKRFDVIYSHELQHLVDARRFLPISSHLLWNIYQFAVHGFSTFNVEAWLEGRAQLLALFLAEDSRAVLAEVADHIRGDATIRSPHRKGYTALIRRFVDYISKHPDQFPSIDVQASILHQLHRMSGEQIRRVARELAAEDGLLSTS